MEMTKDDRMLLARVEDKLQQCSEQYRVTCTDFLDLRQRSLVENMCRGLKLGSGDIRYVFYGGYEDAERTVAAFLPDYGDERDCPLSAIRIKTHAGGRKLTHRDYLGSLTGLGLKREMIGDILVGDEGADVIIKEEVKDFILMNYSKAGRANLSLEAVDIENLHVPETRVETVKDTVASLRLDNVIASAFRLSRAKAAEAIRSGLVFVNSMESEKPDMQVEEGSKLVLRGKGKAYLREVGGRTRKDRMYIVIERFM